MNLKVNVLKGVRVRLVNPVIAADYAEDMKNGAVFPPLIVFSDGTDYWLADGFHRLEAAKLAGFLEVESDMREGGERDALLFACGANASHGFRRTNADKRHAVEILLKDEEWRQWTDVAIARACAVSSAYVGKVRLELNGEIPVPDERMAGPGRTIKVGRRGRPKAAVPKAPTAEGVLPQEFEDSAVNGPDVVEDTRPTMRVVGESTDPRAARDQDSRPTLRVVKAGVDAVAQAELVGEAADQECQSAKPRDIHHPPHWLKRSHPKLELVKQAGAPRYCVVLHSLASEKAQAEADLDEVRRWLRQLG